MFGNPPTICVIAVVLSDDTIVGHLPRNGSSGLRRTSILVQRHVVSWEGSGSRRGKGSLEKVRLCWGFVDLFLTKGGQNHEILKFESKKYALYGTVGDFVVF